MKQVIILQNGKKLNKNQFVQYFERKILYTIRRYDLLKDIKRKNCSMVVSDFFVLKKIGKTIISKECLDDIALQVLEIFMKRGNIRKEIKKLLPITIANNKKIIRPFYLMTRKEIELYAKLRRIKSEKNKENLISMWLDDFEKEHKEVKNAIVNSVLKMTS